MKILIVEDDLNILLTLTRGLEESSHTIDKADNGSDGLYLASTNKYDVIILDWMLPQKSGIDILKTIRSKKISTPILMLTAKDQVKDKIEGLKSGCDDYLSKPFSFDELEARIEALHRRFLNDYSNSVVTVKDIVIDKEKRKVSKNNEEINLSAKEMDVLFLLVNNKNNFISKAMIEELLYNVDQNISSNVVSVTIHNLRKKIGEDIIKNFRGLGYKVEI